jgi:transposase-like protein
MPTNRITMRRIRETLRLHLQAGLSYSEIARALKISKSAAGKYVSLARAAGVDWEAAQSLTDEQLEARLYRAALPRSSHQLAPDFALVHQELKRPGVTLQLLWEEYARSNALAYKYTSFSVKYRQFAQSLKRSMRQVHIAGEKLFVDYAGQTVPLIDAATGEITQAQIFVATLGASNFTYACATERQTTADWIGAQVRALEYIGGVPRLQVAHGDGSFARRLTQLAKLDLLVIDDFAISPMGAAERNDLLEVLDDRIGSRSTLITSQLPVKAWHTYLDDPTLADAILDRVVHSSHKIELKGKSLREKTEDK